jgi:hypothetical protein
MDKTVLEKKISEFWEKDIWKCNVKHIHNDKIKNTLSQIQKLVQSLKPNKKFYLMSDGDFKIKSNNKIEIQIENLKNENIIYIKTHADCIPEYHNLIIEFKKRTLFLPPTL